MKFDITTRTLALEPKDCRTCLYGAGERGQYTGSATCPVCDGSGRGPRGGARSCRNCLGSGNVPDFDNPIPCPSCGGNWKDSDSENFCDRAPVEAVLSMPIRIARLGRDNTFNENYIGLGCLYSVTDYGDAAAMTDEALTAKVIESLKDDRTQATKIVKPYARGDEVAYLHDMLVIAVTRNGYSVRAMSLS